MFSIASRRREMEETKLVRRLIHENTSRRRTYVDLRWSDHQLRRSAPVLFGPWDNGLPSPDRLSFAVTKDLTKHGMSVVLPQPWGVVDVVCGYWDRDAPTLVRGKVRRVTRLSAHSWQIGIQFLEGLQASSLPNFEDFRDLLKELDPTPLDPVS